MIKRGNKCQFNQLAQISGPHFSEPPRKQLALHRPCASNGSCLPIMYFHSHQCWLTCRSTGPIAAGRHLGYKSLAQIPPRRNRPVSFNVRPQKSPSVQFLALGTWHAHEAECTDGLHNHWRDHEYGDVCQRFRNPRDYSTQKALWSGQMAKTKRHCKSSTRRSNHAYG